jgi:hypothetical protein
MEKKTPHQLLEMVFSLGRMNEGLVLVEPQTYSEWDGMSVKEYAAPDGITTILADPENGRPLVKLLIDNEGRIISRTRYSYSVSTPYPAAIFFETGDMEQKGAEEFYKTIRQSFEILPLDEDKEEMRRRAARFSELPEGVNVHEGNRETGKRRFIPRDRER